MANLIKEAEKKAAEKGEAPLWWIKFSAPLGSELSAGQGFKSFDEAFDHLWTSTLEQYSTLGKGMTKDHARNYLAERWDNIISTPEDLRYSIDFYFPSAP